LIDQGRDPFDRIAPLDFDLVSASRFLRFSSPAKSRMIGSRPSEPHNRTTMEEHMRMCALPAAMAGAVLTAAVAGAGPAGAMTFSGPSGVLSAAAATDATQAQPVRWCNRHGCWSGGGVPYWPGPPYGLYQSYPYVGYNIVPGGYYYHPLVWPHAWGYRPW
jgi:hypothetical protein